MDTKHNPSDKNTSRGNNECHGTNCLKKNNEIHDQPTAIGAYSERGI